jgi:hypothetical protein
LEPSCRHLSPNVVQLFKNILWLRFEGPGVERSCLSTSNECVCQLNTVVCANLITRASLSGAPRMSAGVCQLHTVVRVNDETDSCSVRYRSQFEKTTSQNGETVLRRARIEGSWTVASLNFDLESKKNLINHTLSGAPQSR